MCFCILRKGSKDGLSEARGSGQEPHSISGVQRTRNTDVSCAEPAPLELETRAEPYTQKAPKGAFCVGRRDLFRRMVTLHGKACAATLIKLGKDDLKETMLLTSLCLINDDLLRKYDRARE